jgi:hypothetical protein
MTIYPLPVDPLLPHLLTTFPNWIEGAGEGGEHRAGDRTTARDRQATPSLFPIDGGGSPLLLPHRRRGGSPLLLPQRRLPSPSSPEAAARSALEGAACCPWHGGSPLPLPHRRCGGSPLPLHHRRRGSSPLPLVPSTARRRLGAAGWVEDGISAVDSAPGSPRCHPPSSLSRSNKFILNLHLFCLSKWISSVLFVDWCIYNNNACLKR